MADFKNLFHFTTKSLAEMDAYPAIKNEDDLFNTSIDALKEYFKSMEDSTFIAFLNSIFNEERVMKLDLAKIESLAEILLCSVTANQCELLGGNFMQKLERRRAVLAPENDPPSEKMIWNIYISNREVFEYLTVMRWKSSSTGESNISCIGEKNLCMLETVLAKDFYCKNAADDLFTNISLDHKARHNDILDIILECAVTEDVRLEYLDKVFGLLASKYAKDFTENIKEFDVNQRIKEYLFGHNRRWISRYTKDPIMTISNIVKVLVKYGVSPTDVIFNPNKHSDILCECQSLDVIRFCIGHLPTEQVKEALQTKGGRLLYTIIDSKIIYLSGENPGAKENPAEELTEAIEMFEKVGVDMSPIFMSREHTDRLTLLDYVCLYSNIEFVKVILNKMRDEDKKTLLFIKNYGGRAPIDHASYYNMRGNNSTKHQLIYDEMARLSK